MKTDKQGSEALQRLADALEHQHIGMLTLADPDGELAARPLTALQMDDQGSFWFFVSRAVWSQLVGSGTRVNLAFSDEGKATYVSISAHAALVDDAGLREALWTAAARPWFPKGADDPDLALLRVAPRHADVWDGPDSHVVRLAAMTASVVAGRPIGLGDHERLDT